MIWNCSSCGKVIEYVTVDELNAHVCFAPPRQVTVASFIAALGKAHLDDGKGNRLVCDGRDRIGGVWKP